MPSPIGHALGGMACGWLVGGRLSVRPNQPRWADTARFGILGALADIDFVFGTHSTYSHSVGACAVVGISALVWHRGQRAATLALAVTAAYGSHLLLDWLGSDTTPPIGIMALWPFTSEFHQSDLHWFMAIRRRDWPSSFWSHNLQAVAWEIAILAPLAAAVRWLRVRPSPRAGQADGADSVTSISLP